MYFESGISKFSFCFFHIEPDNCLSTRECNPLRFIVFLNIFRFISTISCGTFYLLCFLMPFLPLFLSSFWIDQGFHISLFPSINLEITCSVSTLSGVILKLLSSQLDLNSKVNITTLFLNNIRNLEYFNPSYISLSNILDSSTSVLYPKCYYFHYCWL